MYLIYDLESSFTTQEDSPSDFKELLEIGAVIVNDNYSHVDSFQSYVGLKYYALSEECNMFLGNIRKKVEQALPLPAVWCRFEKWRQQYPIKKTAAWGISDETFLKGQIERYGISTNYFDVQFVDLKKAFRKSRPTHIPPVGLIKACEIIR